MQKWLKEEYPKIKKMAQSQSADVYFGDAAHMRSDHHGGARGARRAKLPFWERRGRGTP